MRAVIYARYSSDLQSACSIEDQVRLYRYRIEAEGWSLVNTYTDHALSGASRLRSGYQKLLEDARGVSTSSWRKRSTGCRVTRRTLPPCTSSWASPACVW